MLIRLKKNEQQNARTSNLLIKIDSIRKDSNIPFTLQRFKYFVAITRY